MTFLGKRRNGVGKKLELTFAGQPFTPEYFWMEGLWTTILDCQLPSQLNLCACTSIYACWIYHPNSDNELTVNVGLITIIVNSFLLDVARKNID